MAVGLRWCRKPVDERGTGARIVEVVEVADVATLVEDVPRQVTAGPVKHGVGVDDEVVVASLVDDVIAGEHAEALEPVSALDVACDHAHRAERRSIQVVEQRDQRRLGIIASSPGTSDGTVRDRMISRAIRFVTS